MSPAVLGYGDEGAGDGKIPAGAALVFKIELISVQTMTASAPLAERAIALLERLIAFDTTSALSNLELIAWVEDYLAGRGVASRAGGLGGREEGQSAGHGGTVRRRRRRAVRPHRCRAGEGPAVDLRSRSS